MLKLRENIYRVKYIRLPNLAVVNFDDEEFVLKTLVNGEEQSYLLSNQDKEYHATISSDITLYDYKNEVLKDLCVRCLGDENILDNEVVINLNNYYVDDYIIFNKDFCHVVLYPVGGENKLVKIINVVFDKGNMLLWTRINDNVGIPMINED